MVLISSVTFPYPPDPIKDPHFFVFFPLVLRDGFGYNLGWLLGFHGLGTLLLFFTLLVLTCIVTVVPAGELVLTARKLRLDAMAAACACLLLVMGFLSSPAPDAREYYARGLVYAFLGKYEQASADMNTALLKNSDSELQQRINRAISQLDRLIQQSRLPTQ
jgi:hypothetical protein